MPFNAKRLPLIILFLLIFTGNFFCIIALAEGNNPNGIVLTTNGTLEGAISHNANNIYDDLSFWQLPLWVQLTFISFTLLGALAVIKISPFLFGRLKHALENSKTKNIFNFIQRNPGITIAELSDKENINRGTLKYHLSQLLTNNKIVFIKNGKFSRLFYNNSSATDKESTISRYMRNDKSRDILFTIMGTPGVTNQEISARFKLAKSTTHDYLRGMFEDGLLEFSQDGKFKRCYVTQDTRMILLRYKPQ